MEDKVVDKTVDVMTDEMIDKMDHELDDEYNMNHRNRGKALIFNQKNFDKSLGLSIRDGTDVDCNRLNQVFKKLDFDVSVYTDLSFREIVSVVKNVASENHEDNDCIAVAILSHGGSGSTDSSFWSFIISRKDDSGHIYAKDQNFKISEIYNHLTPNNCPTLAGKPKLFFIQACKGDFVDTGYDQLNTERYPPGASFMFPNEKFIRLPLHADFLIYFSTTPGFVSYRHITNGSWFIQTLCDVLEEKGSDLEILSLLTLVNRRVATDFESYNENRKIIVKQMPCFETRLLYKLRFKKKSKQVKSEEPEPVTPQQIEAVNLNESGKSI